MTPNHGGLDPAAAVDVAVCPRPIYLFPMAEAVADCPVTLGAQDLHFESSEAFTGKVSAAMVAETGTRYVIAWHSERRLTIGRLEDDRMINRKVRAAVGAGLTAILCVGETLPEHEAGERIFLSIGCGFCL